MSSAHICPNWMNNKREMECSKNSLPCHHSLTIAYFSTKYFFIFYSYLFFFISNFQNDGTKTDTLSSLPQASFNYINSIVGSGVIGIPYAFHRAGFGLGLLLLIIVAVITDYSLILMVSHIYKSFSLDISVFYIFNAIVNWISMLSVEQIMDFAKYIREWTSFESMH